VHGTKTDEIFCSSRTPIDRAPKAFWLLESGVILAIFSLSFRDCDYVETDVTIPEFFFPLFLVVFPSRDSRNKRTYSRTVIACVSRIDSSCSILSTYSRDHLFLLLLLRLFFTPSSHRHYYRVLLFFVRGKKFLSFSSFRVWRFLGLCSWSWRAQSLQGFFGFPVSKVKLFLCFFEEVQFTMLVIWMSFSSSSSSSSSSSMIRVSICVAWRLVCITEYMYVYHVWSMLPCYSLKCGDWNHLKEQKEGIFWSSSEF
jgi:hypothetical protein